MVKGKYCSWSEIRVNLLECRFGSFSSVLLLCLAKVSMCESKPLFASDLNA